MPRHDHGHRHANADLLDSSASPLRGNEPHKQGLVRRNGRRDGALDGGRIQLGRVLPVVGGIDAARPATRRCSNHTHTQRHRHRQTPLSQHPAPTDTPSRGGKPGDKSPPQREWFLQPDTGLTTVAEPRTHQTDKRGQCHGDDRSVRHTHHLFEPDSNGVDILHRPPEPGAATVIKGRHY